MSEAMGWVNFRACLFLRALLLRLFLFLCVCVCVCRHGGGGGGGGDINSGGELVINSSD